MSASGAETSTQLPPPAARVFFQAAPTGGRVGTGPATKDDSVQKKNGKVTVKYDRKELRKRLILEEWIIEQLSELYDCEDEEMPEVEIDIDDILDATSEDERAIKLQESLVDCYKPTEEFIKELLSRIRGMRKLSAPQKKGL
ncbi:protein phosphatase 1 regulatory subunit 14C-like isoform X2 [Polyodon spathula]|uniref:protein phosphatase 1 regulatory subunit 14C-like isoform X2 n=1 Tax=Polyodon spathula TaxID=7913 RepID=UPI001B7E7F1B|nr:protein phosphatase 1 regulatory subunit 14C-like isoform X2 [Polyodon spathula]